MSELQPKKPREQNFGNIVKRVFELINPPAIAAKNQEAIEPKPRENDVAESIRQTNEIRHKSYLELRGKAESIGASARLEMDKSILTLSSAGVALTLGLIDHFHLLVWQALIIMLFFMAAIVTVLLSMRVTEQSAEVFIDVIDRAYDVSVAENIGDLPVEKVISESEPKTKRLLTRSNEELEQLNNYSFGFFLSAIASLIMFAVIRHHF